MLLELTISYSAHIEIKITPVLNLASLYSEVILTSPFCPSLWLGCKNVLIDIFLTPQCGFARIKCPRKLWDVGYMFDFFSPFINTVDNESPSCRWIWAVGETDTIKGSPTQGHSFFSTNCRNCFITTSVDHGSLSKPILVEVAKKKFREKTHPNSIHRLFYHWFTMTWSRLDRFF